MGAGEEPGPTEESGPTPTERAGAAGVAGGGGRRGWLVAAAVAFVLVTGGIVVLAQGGGDDRSGDMGGMDMGGMDMGGTAEIPEARPASVTRMGEMIMPPGMIMTAGASMASMADMAAVDSREVDFEAAPDARGDEVLEGVVGSDGVREYRLEASVVRWFILPEVPVLAYAFNGQVPGPRLTATRGDRVRIRVDNRLAEPTSVHWHGLVVPNAMDGAAGVTEEAIPPGGSRTYEFTVEADGTFFYHSHTAADRQQALGLSGAFVVRPPEPVDDGVDQDVVVAIQEWTVRDGFTFPAMPMEGLLPNYFTLNGKAWPETPVVRARVGDRLRFRFIGSGSFAHPMHIHGGPFTIVATDGQPVPPGAQLSKDTVNVAPGERYDVVWTAQQPGRWLLHCHINHHLTNDGEEVDGAGGLTMVIDVAG